MAYCGKCLHLDVCKTTDSCDGHVPRCKHFMDKDEHPKLKHGRWVVENEESIRCPNCCFNRASIKMPLNYCPNCGAKMVGGDEGV